MAEAIIKDVHPPGINQSECVQALQMLNLGLAKTLSVTFIRVGLYGVRENSPEGNAPWRQFTMNL